jgi:hypothetical protein
MSLCLCSAAARSNDGDHVALASWGMRRFRQTTAAGGGDGTVTGAREPPGLRRQYRLRRRLLAVVTVAIQRLKLVLDNQTNDVKVATRISISTLAISSHLAFLPQRLQGRPALGVWPQAARRPS